MNEASFPLDVKDHCESMPKRPRSSLNQIILFAYATEPSISSPRVRIAWKASTDEDSLRIRSLRLVQKTKLPQSKLKTPLQDGEQSLIRPLDGTESDEEALDREPQAKS